MKCFSRVSLLVFLSFYSLFSAAAIFLRVEGIDGSVTASGHEQWIDFLSVSTGGSGGEDRLIDYLDTVFISTGGSGGEDRLTDLLSQIAVYDETPVGDVVFTDLLDPIMNLDDGSSLSQYLMTIPLTAPTSTVFISAYDVFHSLNVSAEVANLFDGYQSYYIDSTPVPEPGTLWLMLAGLLLAFYVYVRSTSDAAQVNLRLEAEE